MANWFDQWPSPPVSGGSLMNAALADAGHCGRRRHHAVEEARLLRLGSDSVPATWSRSSARTRSGVKPGSTRVRLNDRADHQPGADEQNDGNGDLSGGQQRLKAAPFAARSARTGRPRSSVLAGSAARPPSPARGRREFRSTPRRAAGTRSARPSSATWSRRGTSNPSNRRAIQQERRAAQPRRHRRPTGSRLR